MTQFALLLLLGASTQAGLTDQVFQVPASQWRGFEVSVRQAPARMDGDFSVVDGRATVRMALLARADFERLRAERPHGFLAATELERGGKLRHHIRTPGDYFVVLDNRENALPAAVRVRVSLEFAPEPEPRTRYVSPRRRAAAILISLGLFAGIVTWSAGKLLRIVRR